ncbi:hypothetical protein QYE76_031638 [Lolium multiflorum]|uniref:CCHC-type domain-containing protein n=1 Tax=Lolium multiflorum TaxID=4521 RepID=A0AAD8QS19_LOLMU|nr:hypothetical protein QYE76_031638 [Lolium multiflorum]
MELRASCCCVCCAAERKSSSNAACKQRGSAAALCPVCVRFGGSRQGINRGMGCVQVHQIKRRHAGIAHAAINASGGGSWGGCCAGRYARGRARGTGARALAVRLGRGELAGEWAAGDWAARDGPVGLNPQFKVQLRMLRATEFQELVDAAITLEDDFKQLQEEKRKKARFEPKKFVSNKPNTGLSFKPRYNNNYNNRASSNPNMAQIVCRSCGFSGLLEGLQETKMICFGCRQEGHMLRDCPKRKNGGGQSGGGGNRSGNSGGNWKNKKPFGKLNCTSLVEVINPSRQ